MKQLKNLTLFFAFFFGIVNGDESLEIEAAELVQEFNAKEMIEANKAAEARWNYESDMTSEHEDEQKKVLEDYAIFNKQVAMKLKDYDFDNFTNETLKRLIKKMTDIGDAILDPETFTELHGAITNMKNIYAKTKIPSFKVENGAMMNSLEPEITNILGTSRDPEELKYYWTKWHDATGSPNSEDFWKYVELRNIAAQANGELS